MECLKSKTRDFTWPYENKDLEEDLLKYNLLETVWSEKYLAGTEVSLMRPELIDNFENRRVWFNSEEGCYHLFKKPAEDLYEAGFKRPDFIFKTGSNEVTLIEVKVCWLGLLDKLYPEWYTYNVDKDSSEKGEVFVKDGKDCDFVRCDTRDHLKNRAEEQARENASLLREILPSNIVVKYHSFVAVQNHKSKNIEFFF